MKHHIQTVALVANSSMHELQLVESMVGHSSWIYIKKGLNKGKYKPSLGLRSMLTAPHVHNISSDFNLS